MDGTKFDNLARKLSASTDRRTAFKALAALAGGAFGSVIGVETGLTASRCRAGALICRKNGDCCTKICEPPDASGHQRCKCEPGLTLCNGNTCKDLQNDVANCGSCGNVCPKSQCRTAVCNAGICGTVPNSKANGRTCDDGDLCTVNDVCLDGACAGTPIVCPTCKSCVAGVCQVVVDGTVCDNGDACSIDDHCVAGSCVGDPLPCPQCKTCSNGTCVNGHEGESCNDNNTCTTNDHCQAGVCVGDAVNCPVCQACTGGTCAPIAEDGRCSGGCCGGACFDLNTDEANCGGCGSACDTNQVCNGGVCEDVPGQCVAVGSGCDSDGDCCNHHCLLDVCVCTEPGIFPIVNVIPLPCSDDSQCCDGKCLSVEGVGGCTLLPIGAPCEHPWHCVTKNCNKVPLGDGRICSPFD